MNFQSLLTEKWPYKVAAIVLSILLWLNVTANQPTQDEAIRTRIEYQVLDSAWAIGEAVDEVTTIFQGRAGDIIALLNAPVIRVVIDSPADSVVEVSLNVDDVVYDRSLNAIATAVSPARVFVHLEPRRVVTVPVMSITDARAAPGYAIDQIVVRPESVTVSGPASIVDPVIGIPTERLVVGEVNESVTRLLGLQPPAGSRGLEITPSQVSMTVEVDTMIVRRFQVTVSVQGDAASGVVVDPQVVRVDVSGAARTVATLAPTDLQASVRVDEAPTGSETAVVSVRLPDGVDAQAVSTPARVTVRSGPGPSPASGESP
jgi:YbbR domain-containing protein